MTDRSEVDAEDDEEELSFQSRLNGGGKADTAACVLGVHPVLGVIPELRPTKTGVERIAGCGIGVHVFGVVARGNEIVVTKEEDERDGEVDDGREMEVSEGENEVADDDDAEEEKFWSWTSWLPNFGDESEEDDDESSKDEVDADADEDCLTFSSSSFSRRCS